MTSLESLVPSLDLCRQLQAAGFPQDTAMVYAYIKDANSKIVRVVMPRRDAEAGCIGADCDGQMILCAAPTLSELLDVLEPSQCSAEKMVALAHALIALHDEVAG